MMTPYFTTFQEFLQMGTHGVYVWACYLLVFVALVAFIIHARAERKAILARLTRQQSQTRLTNKQRQHPAE